MVYLGFRPISPAQHSPVQGSDNTFPGMIIFLNTVFIFDWLFKWFLYYLMWQNILSWSKFFPRCIKMIFTASNTNQVDSGLNNDNKMWGEILRLIHWYNDQVSGALHMSTSMCSNISIHICKMTYTISRAPMTHPKAQRRKPPFFSLIQLHSEEGNGTVYNNRNEQSLLFGENWFT